jgi:hypothetical protein
MYLDLPRELQGGGLSINILNSEGRVERSDFLKVLPDRIEMDVARLLAGIYIYPVSVVHFPANRKFIRL